MWKLLTLRKPPSPLDQALKLFPHDPEGIVRACEEAIRINPKDAEAYLWLGQSFETLGQLERASEAYEVAVHLEPNNYACLMFLGFIRRRRDDIAGAVECYRQLIEVDPTSSTAWQVYILMLSEQGELDQALAAAQSALKANPHHLTLLLNLGKVHEKRGETVAAIQAYRAATRAEIHFSSKASNRLGEWIGRRIIDLPFRRMMIPTQFGLHGHAHYRLGCLLADNGQLEEARREWQSALGLYRDAQALDPANAQMEEKSIDRVRKKLEDLENPAPKDASGPS